MNTSSPAMDSSTGGGATGLIAAWNDYRNVSTAADLYANRVFADMIFVHGFEDGSTSHW